MPNILLVKTSSLGDVVHNLPVVSDIIEHVPDAHVDWVVEEGFAGVPALHPGIERVIPIALRRWRRRLLAPATWREIGALRRAVQARRYDLVLDTQGLLKSALIAALAAGAVTGQDRKSAREPSAAWFYQRVFPASRDLHAVIRNRELAAKALGYPTPATPPNYGLRVPINTETAATLPARYAACFHGTSRDDKRWPDAHWVNLGRALGSRGLTLLLSWGDTQEHARAQTIAASIPNAMVPATRLGMRELPTVLAKAAVVIGVDTGLMHLAAALGRPTVAIYVDSAPRLSGAFPSDPASAVNLGGQGTPPQVAEVIGALERLGVV
jgi:heptosyltransferase-1